MLDTSSASYPNSRTLHQLMRSAMGGGPKCGMHPQHEIHLCILVDLVECDVNYFTEWNLDLVTSPELTQYLYSIISTALSPHDSEQTTDVPSSDNFAQRHQFAYRCRTRRRGYKGSTPYCIGGSIQVPGRHKWASGWRKIRRNEDMDEEDRESVVAEDERLPVGWSVSVG